VASHLTALPSTSSDETPQPAHPPLGSITPRVWTRPLRKLTPRTSYGYAVVWFAAEVLHAPLDPWQQWAVIHLGEMLPDGRPRFRQVLIIVARQNGKTHLCKVLALFWLFVECWPMVFGTSTNLEQAKEAWEEAVNLARASDALAPRIPRGGVRVGNGQQVLSTTDRARYKIGAADRKGGRGKAIDRAIGDELREQHTWEAYQAAYNAMNARPRAQVVYITNMGDSRSVVLNALRKDASDAIESAQGGEQEQRPIGLFEWSAPPGSHPTDRAAHAAANPQYGRRMDPDTIMSAARRVSKPGADPADLAGFLTEMLCLTVDQLDPAIDGLGWQAGRLPAAFPADVRPAMCIDCSPDMLHASIVVAAAVPGPEGAVRYRVEMIAAYDGIDALQKLGAAVGGIAAAVRPRAIGWFPNGPAAALDAQLRDRRKSGRYGWPPRGIEVAELKAETAGVVMAFANLVSTGTVVHSGQALLDAQTAAAEKAWTSDKWVLVRRGAGHVDGVYAAAGAVHLARTVPAPRKAANRLITAGG
jgi:hypothetical protein